MKLVFLTVALLLTAYGQLSLAGGCPDLPAKLNIKSMQFTYTDYTGKYLVTFELQNLSNLSCQESSDYNDQNTPVDKYLNNFGGPTTSLGKATTKNLETGYIYEGDVYLASPILIKDGVDMKPVDDPEIYFTMGFSPPISAIVAGTDADDKNHNPSDLVVERW